LEEQFADRPVVILIGGKAGTGKTETSMLLSSLVDSLGFLDFVTMNFAYGVKSTAKESFGWNGVKDKKGRQLLQNVGNTGREYDLDIWAKQTVQRILDNPCLYDFVFIDDWRFPNESNFLAKALGDLYLVKTLYVSAPDREILKGTPAYEDVSETSLDSFGKDDFDFHIENSGSLDELKNKLKEVLESILLETKLEV
jgi:hypothetical protein